MSKKPVWCWITWDLNSCDDIHVHSKDVKPEGWDVCVRGVCHVPEMKPLASETDNE